MGVVTPPLGAQDKHAEDSDSEKEEMELGDIVKLLEKHDPSYMRWVWPLGKWACPNYILNFVEDHLLVVPHLLTWQVVTS